MNKSYQLTNGTMLEYLDTELIIVNVETGFSASGNKYAYEILQLMEVPITVESTIEKLSKKYPKSQHSRIVKSVPNVIRWALEREVIEEIPSPTPTIEDLKPD